MPAVYADGEESVKRLDTTVEKIDKAPLTISKKDEKTKKDKKTKKLSKNTVAKATLDQESITLTNDNTLVMNKAFRWSTVAKILLQAKKMDANLPSGYPIFLVMDTPGGGITSGLELIEFLSSINRPVHTITLYAASMGFQAVQGLGNRYIVKYGILMAHKARGGFYGEFGDGASQLDSRYGLWMKRILEMDKTAVKRSKGYYTLKTFRAAYENELWLNGFDAVKVGLADKVVKVKCDATLNDSRYETFRFWGFKLMIEYSECPVNSGPLGIRVMIHTNQGYMELDKFLDSGGTLIKRNESSRYSNDYDYSYSFYGHNRRNQTNRESTTSTPRVMRKDLSLELIEQEKQKLLDKLNAPKQVERSY